jgi:hypothetical protein
MIISAESVIASHEYSMWGKGSSGKFADSGGDMEVTAA